jgi:hypothetical protein
MAGLDPGLFWAAVAVTLVGGFVKGAVGFAMPLVMMAAFSAFLPRDLALAGLILPVVATNLAQAFRGGWRAALAAARGLRRFLVATLVCIVLSAQVAEAIPQALFLLLLGVPITLYAAALLAGLPLVIGVGQRARAEWALGTVAGLYGGVSGIWGPPLIVFLLSTGAGKEDSLRAQGVVFLLGGLVLMAAHLQTGLLDARTLPFSAAMVVPAMLGLALGFRAADRMDAGLFKRLTQAALVVSGLNLVRLAVVG